MKVSWNILFWLAFHVDGFQGFSQQIIWAKLYALPTEDQINCITHDSDGNLYAGGSNYINPTFPFHAPRSVIYKLGPDGDTIYSLMPDIFGEVKSIVIHPTGNLCVAVFKQGRFPGDPSQLHILKMTPDGFIFKRDTIPNILYVTHSCIGKDSSWVLCGYSLNVINPLNYDTYVQRIRKDGTIEPYFSINNNISEQASKVEQLPNGKYLVSGSAGNKVISYTFDENLSSYQPMTSWYQSMGTSPISSASVGQAEKKGFVLGAQGSPCFVSVLDSLKNKIWFKKDTGVILLPQAMTDGSILSGYSQRPTNPTHLFTRRAADSSSVWFLNLRDSLAARGMQGNLNLNAYTFFKDESAVVACRLYQSGITNFDPLFIKISNVGTPVTSLFKPKRGTLSNETLAPWPNPSGGTLYLKQHFDKADVHFYTVSGREVQTDTVRFGQPIDISSFAPGLYLYRAVIDGKPFSGKVVRN